jgi:hypothetical protein
MAVCVMDVRRNGEWMRGMPEKMVTCQKSFRTW